MHSSEERFFDWNHLRDAEGKLGHIGPLVDLIAERAARRLPIEIAPLTEILLIPGVLCSAAPRVIRDFLTVIPEALAKTKQDLLAIVFDLSETISAPHQESIKSHSEGAISPYSSYESLRNCVTLEIKTGERLYRSEFVTRPLKQITDRELFAAVLLSRCDVADAALLNNYDAAISTEKNPRNQALLLNAAASVAERCGTRSSYLSQYLDRTRDVQQFSAVRVLSASYLAESLSDADLRSAVGDASARLHISLPDILSPLNANTRFRIYKAIFLAGAPSQAESFWYALELLRSVFDHPATYDWMSNSDFQFNTAPANLRTELRPAEREALGILVNCDAVWAKRSNVWRHFGLPDNRQAARQLANGKS